ncbi:hypothetical protein RHMOL_Rhmol12G0134800 [Rhododendron molle]|uniref:Uncharacterized protein n=1 Tax=Rhododendron molle TaxID=49168 RepID=A0ACC0LHJ7_RHOML|nr:hypothetical protein RHMOL_Rhmol12G0134800 [Rhododendron molle]
MHYKHDHHPFPCLHCHPHSYIRMSYISMGDGSVERATKRESGLFSSLFPWRFYKAGLSIVTTPPARNAKNQSHPLRRQQMCGHLSV